MRARALLALVVVTPLGFATKLYAGPGAGWVADHAGGILYVVFWILVGVVLVPRARPALLALVVLGLTCVLELTQLVETHALSTIRSTFLGRTLIGSTFSWWDLPHYALGAVLGGGWAALQLHRSGGRRAGSPGKEPSCSSR